MAAARLVVQLPVSESTDFDSLLDVENALALSLLKDRAAAVDGHQLGQGKFSIFIVPGAAPGTIVDRVRTALAQDGMLDGALIAMQASADDPYSVVWPDNYSGTFAL